MTWWIAFIIAVLGWYFTAIQNSKNSARTLINQEINVVRSKLSDIIMACYDEEEEHLLPFKLESEDFVKIQMYIVSSQELDRLYYSYHSYQLKNIRVVSDVLSIISKFKVFKLVKEYLAYWFFLPEKPLPVFILTEHISSIRQALTSDDDKNDAERLAILHFEYKQLCLAYPLVG